MVLLVKRVIDEDATVYILLGVLLLVAAVLWVVNRMLTSRAATG